METPMALRLAALEEENAVLRAALGKYKHCRHACIDCTCTCDARATLAAVARRKGYDDGS